MFKFRLWLILSLMASFVFISCEKDDPEIVNEEELITTLRYILVPADGGDMVVMSFVDLDGDGEDAPVVVGGSLDSNTTYMATLELLNEAEMPSEDITEEIMEEDEDHQFFFESSLTDLVVTYDDQDSDGKPVGLSSTLVTGSSGSGTLDITLKHKPVKDASGVSDGDITNAGGETDIAVSFPINVN